MSTLFRLAPAALAFILGQAAFAEPSVTHIIGRCRFKGPELTSGLEYGTLKIYHSGKLEKISHTSDMRTWKCTGSVWVIRGSEEDVKQNKFYVSGTIQTCDDFDPPQSLKRRR